MAVLGSSARHPRPTPVRRLAAGVAVVAAATTACGAPGETSGDERLVLVVGDRPAPTRPAELAVWEEQVARFEREHPDVRVEGRERAYDPDSFPVLASGGDLPTVLLVPFTEPQSLLQRGLVADITAELDGSGLLEVLNDGLLPAVSDADGAVHGVPTAAYAMGLVVNRAVLAEAGLDPDDPPRTWAEVRAVAAQVAERTDAVGFGHASQGNGGGFVLTAETYGAGGRVQSEDGEELRLTEGPVAEVLETLQAMRWEDGSTGEESVQDLDDLGRELAAGRLGMYVAAPDAWRHVVTTNGLPPEDFGMGPLPRGTDGTYGTLTGGTVAVVSPAATPEERRAAVAWIDSFYLERYRDRDAALAEAEAVRGSGVPLGLPAVPVVDAEAYERWEGWVADEVEVPLGNFASYVEALPRQELVPEPVREAQQVYAALDVPVQTVLSEEDVDVPALLAATQETLARSIARG